MYQEMGKHMYGHICREHGMIGVVRSVVQRELRMANGKLRPERCLQGLFHDVSPRPCCGLGFVMKALWSCRRVLSNVILCSLWLRYE